MLGQLKRDDLIIAPHDCYGGTYRLLSTRRDKGHFDVAFIDQGDDAALSENLKRAPSLVLIETPSNPLMRVVDIRSIAARAKAVGAKVAVDNTFLSPALQRPIALGADFVIHSTTKYLNGHSDVIGGAVIAADKADVEALLDWAKITGVTGAPFDAYLTLRGLRTLFPRIERQQATAAAVAAFLQRQPQVRAVHYPGLKSHPGHAIAQAQQAGFGAMLSFELAGGVEAVRRFVESGGGVYAGGIAWRRGKPGGSSHDHDACRYGRRGTPRGRHQRRFVAALDRSRSRGGSDRRSRNGYPGNRRAKASRTLTGRIAGERQR